MQNYGSGRLCHEIIHVTEKQSTKSSTCIVFVALLGDCQLKLFGRNSMTYNWGK